MEVFKLMLIDKIIEVCPNLRFPHVSELYIKDTIVFFINEPAFLFATNLLDSCEGNLSPMLPSFLPYRNIFLQFNNGVGFWIIEAFIKNNIRDSIIAQNERVICCSHITNKMVLSELYKNPIVQGGVFFRSRLDHGIYDVRWIEGQQLIPISAKLSNEDGSVLDVSIAIIQRFLQFLSCANICTVKCIQNEKLSKKRIKHGKLPFVSYYILKLKRKTKNKKGVERHLWTNRVHLCRGHFKTYTADNPLFGKIIGKYWWPPHARGDKKQGIILKDYTL
ncbi:MAG: hypothetical protein B7C24_17230 [Bacteroidetes bacterium 4572_77]|nr:MAG: hypothetical protein B7C24_17230 [Bacteroidetes bacterium 4572_77]